MNIDYVKFKMVEMAEFTSLKLLDLPNSARPEACSGEFDSNRVIGEESQGWDNGRALC